MGIINLADVIINNKWGKLGANKLYYGTTGPLFILGYSYFAAG
jgi:hypothetical protein